MPAPFSVDSTSTGLPVFTVDNSGNVIMIGTLTAAGGVTFPDGAVLTGSPTVSGTVTAAGLVVLSAAAALGFGPAGGPVDVSLSRYTAQALQVDGLAFKIAGGATLLFGTAGDVNLLRATSDVLATDNNFAIRTAGKGLQVKEGSNATMGVSAAMSAGTITISTTAVTANSRIHLTAQTSGAAPGALRVSARTPGTSFVITSTSGTDTSTVAWMIVEPSA